MTLFGSSKRPAVLSEVSDNGQSSRTPLSAMGLFSKKKKEAGSAKKPGEASPSAAGGDANDPLGLATPPPAGHAASASAQQKDSPARLTSGGSIDPGSGHRVALHAAQFLTEIAAETRGLFEEVRPVAEVKGVWDVLAQGPDILAAAQMAESAERLSALRAVLPHLPEHTRTLLAAICQMVAAVAHEHDSCYKDGVLTRQAALAQLFGPLMLRPLPPSFEADMTAAVQLAKDLFSTPSLLTPLLPIASPALSSPAASPISAKKSFADAVAPGRPKTPAGPTPFPGRASAVAAGAAGVAAASPVPKLGLKSVGAGGGGAASARPPKGGVTFREDAVGGAERGGSNSSDDTSYINPGLARVDPAHKAFVAKVAALSDADRKMHLQGAMKGTAMLKYSSRGRAVAVMFFRLSEDAETLNWAHAASPEDLKYGLMLETVVKVLPGAALARGSFAGAGPDSKPARRLVVLMTADQNLEVEALSEAHMEMWSVALQHVLNGRAGAAVAFDGAPATHRNWGAQLTARPGMGVASLSLPRAPFPAHGSQTARLLQGVGEGGRGGGG
ncbi:hypothetical protein T484DRAFT_1885452, partial [Baffinella frigidus]